MKTKTLKTLVLVLSVVLTALLVVLGVLLATRESGEMQLEQPSATQPAATQPVTTQPVTQPTTTPPVTTQPEEVTEPTQPEPTAQKYMLTFVGDCTMGSTKKAWSSKKSFVKTVGENYDYPFFNVANYFRQDDFTMVNLECVFADEGNAKTKRYAFRGPTAYTQILTGSSVEAVTLANNHSKDFGTSGYNSTKTSLETAGVAYVEENKTSLFTTESGLVIGLYADAFDFSKSAIQKNIQSLKDGGAEIIICAFHWGKEGSYRANANQKTYARAAIDAGADIVYGHHPHVLQPIEERNGGVIMYSLGNFSFGGSNYPQDYDSAIVQIEVIREVDGTIHLGQRNIIPLSISSLTKRNNFQPTPYDADSKAYKRVISKLDGTFKGKDLVVDYSKFDKNETTPPATTPPAAQ